MEVKGHPETSHDQNAADASFQDTDRSGPADTPHTEKLVEKAAIEPGCPITSNDSKSVETRQQGQVQQMRQPSTEHRPSTEHVDGSMVNLVPVPADSNNGQSPLSERPLTPIQPAELQSPCEFECLIPTVGLVSLTTNAMPTVSRIDVFSDAPQQQSSPILTSISSEKSSFEKDTEQQQQQQQQQQLVHEDASQDDTGGHSAVAATGSPLKTSVKASESFPQSHSGRRLAADHQIPKPAAGIESPPTAKAENSESSPQWLKRKARVPPPRDVMPDVRAAPNRQPGIDVHQTVVQDTAALQSQPQQRQRQEQQQSPQRSPKKQTALVSVSKVQVITPNKSEQSSPRAQQAASRQQGSSSGVGKDVAGQTPKLVVERPKYVGPWQSPKFWATGTGSLLLSLDTPSPVIIFHDEHQVSKNSKIF